MQPCAKARACPCGKRQALATRYTMLLEFSSCCFTDPAPCLRVCSSSRPTDNCTWSPQPAWPSSQAVAAGRQLACWQHSCHADPMPSLQGSQGTAGSMLGKRPAGGRACTATTKRTASGLSHPAASSASGGGLSNCTLASGSSRQQQQGAGPGQVLVRDPVPGQSLTKLDQKLWSICGPSVRRWSARLLPVWSTRACSICHAPQ